MEPLLSRYSLKQQKNDQRSKNPLILLVDFIAIKHFFQGDLYLHLAVVSIALKKWQCTPTLADSFASKSGENLRGRFGTLWSEASDSACESMLKGTGQKTPRRLPILHAANHKSLLWLLTAYKNRVNRVWDSLPSMLFRMKLVTANNYWMHIGPL